MAHSTVSTAALASGSRVAETRANESRTAESRTAAGAPAIRLAERSPLSPSDLTVRGLGFVPVREGLWRVVSRSGAVLGHIEQHTPQGPPGVAPRFRARALLTDGVHQRALGDFGDARSAADCFR